MTCKHDGRQMTALITDAATVEMMVRFHRRLSVCLSDFPHDISKTDVARITKLDDRNVPRSVTKTHLFWTQKVKS